MSASETPQTDESEARFRATWLHSHNAPKDWIVLTVSEVYELKRASNQVQQELNAVLTAVRGHGMGAVAQAALAAARRELQ